MADGAGDGAAATSGEFGRIARFLAPLAAGFPGAYGLLDDAARVDLPAGRALVVTTDAMVAGIHFLPDDRPGDIAHKLLAVNLSDLAAKAADPLGYSLVTALPRRLGEDWLAAFARGLDEGQRRWGLHLLGGDSVSTDGPVCLTLSALGTVPADRGMVRRAGARPGDLIFVSGSIGDGVLGLLAARGQLDPLPDPAMQPWLLDRLRRPEPRLGLIPLLRAHATAAVDISDGLVADLGHLARAGGVGLVLESALVPLSGPAVAALADWPGLLPDLLTGGDDYEVAFTAPPSAEPAVMAAAADAGIPVTRVGRVLSGPADIQVLDRSGQRLNLPSAGWQHFQ